MKKTFFKIMLICLPFLLGGIVVSCQDDLSDSVKLEEQKALKAEVEKAKKVFEDRSPDFPTIQSRTVDGVEKGIVFEPVWEEAFSSNHADGSVTVETHVRLSQPFHVLPQDSKEAYEQTNDDRYLRYLSRAVVLMPGDDSTSYAFLMTIVGSKEYMETHDFQLWDVSYGKIPEDFSGMLFYHSLNGDFVNGWSVSEGRIFHSCEPISPEDANLLSRSGSSCSTVTVTKYYYECYVASGYTYATYDISENNTQVYQCHGPFPMSESYLVCSDSASNTGGAYNPSADISRLFSSYNTNLRANLQGFISYMDNNDNASRAVLSFIENNLMGLGVYNKMSVDINNNQSSVVNYNYATNTLYFKSVELYTDLEMYEEIIHSIQRVVYPNYGEESFNTEFEAKFIIDYVRLSNGYSGRTDMALNMKYAEVELENGSVKTMARWLDDLSFSIFSVNDYLSYMETWNIFAFDYRNCMMNARSQPQLIYIIIDEMNN